MATAPLTTTLSASQLALTACEVRVWGMNTEEKPFIQTATARHITEKGALLTGVLPVKMGDTIGIRYRDLKGRFKVTWVSDPDPNQTRGVGVDCLEEKNIWRMRIAIPIHNTSAMYSDANKVDGKPNRRKAERYTCRVAADVTLDNAVAQAYAWVSDISAQGCYLQLISPFPVGSGIAISIYAVDLRQGSPLVLRGTVKTSHPMVGMGVEFVDLNADDEKKIAVVLEQLGGVKRQAHTAEPVMLTSDMPPASAASTSIFSLRPALAAASGKREQAVRISLELQQMELQLDAPEFDKAMVEEVRQAVTHLRKALHIWPAP